MVPVTITEPLWYAGGDDEACLLEEAERRFVAHIDIGVELVQVEYAVSVFAQLEECSSSVTLTSAGLDDDDSDLGAAIGGIEVNDVGNTHGLPLHIVDHHAHLTVGIDVGRGVGNIVVEQVAGLGHVGSADVPKRGIILNAVEQVKVFGLNCS